MEELSPIPVAQTYSQIIEFFKDRDRFTQGFYQRDKQGNMCPWRDGYSFCTLGALSHFTDGMAFKAQCLLQRVSEHLYNGEVIQFVNDSNGGYEKVIKALEFARDLWKDQEPTAEELSMSVVDLLKKRNASNNSVL